VSRLADVMECVGEVLQVTNILSNVHVSLDKVPKLGLEVHGMVEFVIKELIVDGVLDDVHGGLWDTHGGEHILGDRVVQPTQEALISECQVGSQRCSKVGGEERWEPRSNLPLNASKMHHHSS
jgi:hypothetical protein